MDIRFIVNSTTQVMIKNTPLYCTFTCQIFNRGYQTKTKIPSLEKDTVSTLDTSADCYTNTQDENTITEDWKAKCLLTPSIPL